MLSFSSDFLDFHRDFRLTGLQTHQWLRLAFLQELLISNYYRTQIFIIPGSNFTLAQNYRYSSLQHFSYCVLTVVYTDEVYSTPTWNHTLVCRPQLPPSGELWSLWWLLSRLTAGWPTAVLQKVPLEKLLYSNILKYYNIQSAPRCPWNGL